MNKILFTLLFASVSFASIQSALAGKFSDEDKKQSVGRSPLKGGVTKPQYVHPIDPNIYKIIPGTPYKNRGVLLKKAAKNPFQYEMRGNEIFKRNTLHHKKVVVKGGKVFMSDASKNLTPAVIKAGQRLDCARPAADNNNN